MLLYNYGNTLIYLYLDLQSEYYQLSLHFIDPGLATDSHESGFRSITYRIRCRTLQSTIVIDLKLFLLDIFDPWCCASWGGVTRDANRFPTI